MFEITKERDYVENAGGDVRATNDPRDRLRVDRVHGEEKAAEEDGEIAPEQGTGEFHHEERAHRVQNHVHQVEAERSEAAAEEVVKSKRQYAEGTVRPVGSAAGDRRAPEVVIPDVWQRSRRKDILIA